MTIVDANHKIEGGYLTNYIDPDTLTVEPTSKVHAAEQVQFTNGPETPHFRRAYKMEASRHGAK